MLILMKMIRALLLIVTGSLATACGGPPGLPPPAPYTPDGTPEPETACKDEREAAKKAREDVLEFGDERRVTAAKKVLAHAECERAQFDRISLHDATRADMLDNIKRARDQYNTAQNLYREVVSYSIVRFMGAQVRIGDLHRAYAAKLRATPAPAEIRGARERSQFVAELRRLADMLDRRAADEYRDVLSKAKTIGPVVQSDPGAKKWISRACSSLFDLDRSANEACTKWGGVMGQ